MLFKTRKAQDKVLKGLQIASQSMIFVQIVLVVLILLVSLHLFLQLIGQKGVVLLNGIIPIIKSLMVFFFGSNIKSSQPQVSGELVLFVLVCIFLVYVCYQLKEVDKKVLEVLENRFEQERLEEEEKFNAELQQELLESTLKMNSFVVAVQLKIKSILNDPVKASMVTADKMMEMKQRVLSDFFDSIKSIPDVSFSKDKDVLITYSTNFDELDRVLVIIQEKLEDVTRKFKQEKILVKAKVAVNTGTSDNTPKQLYSEVFPLFGLNYPGQILCFGNVRGRYAVSKNSFYEVNINGKYDFAGHMETVWAMVKKR